MSDRIVFEMDESMIEVVEAGLGALMEEITRFRYLDVRGRVDQKSKVAQIEAVLSILEANRKPN